MTSAQSNNRLDRIERILENLAERQDTFQSRMDALADRQEVFQSQLNQISNDVAQTSRVVGESIPDLTNMVGSVLHEMTAFTTEMKAISASDSAARQTDRLAEVQARNEFRSTMTGLQAESRNILRELADMRRQQEGNGGQLEQ